MPQLVTKLARSRPHTCQHAQTVNTVNAGLKRTVCVSCRAITVEVEAPGDPGTLFRVKRRAG